MTHNENIKNRTGFGREEFLKLTGAAGVGLFFGGVLEWFFSQTGQGTESTPMIDETVLGWAEYANHRNITFVNYTNTRLRLNGKQIDLLLPPESKAVQDCSLTFSVYENSSVEVNGEPQLLTSYWSNNNRYLSGPVKKGENSERKLFHIPPYETGSAHLSIALYPNTPIVPERDVRGIQSFPAKIKNRVLDLISQRPDDALSVLSTCYVWGLTGLKGAFLTDADIYKDAMSLLDQGVRLFQFDTPPAPPFNQKG